MADTHLNAYETEANQAAEAVVSARAARDTARARYNEQRVAQGLDPVDYLEADLETAKAEVERLADAINVRDHEQEAQKDEEDTETPPNAHGFGEPKSKDKK